MQTTLAPEFKDTPDGDRAEEILRRCVHCGFCTATCPTYQLLGNELDGPRGRIYLIKQVMEGHTPTRKTQLHLDRCLTCRSCETTCPSGVEYGALVEIGRRVVDAKVERPRADRTVRWMLRETMTSPSFGPMLKMGQSVRALLPGIVKNKVPSKLSASAMAHAQRWPTREHRRQVLMLQGCVQPTLAPNINSATARVLDACGVQTLVSDEAGCCGAVRDHLGDREGALTDMRRNIDAWWPKVEGLGGVEPVEAIVFNASGCGLSVKDYGHALAHDPAYAEKAARISAAARDLSELLPTLIGPLKAAFGQRRARGVLAYHPPCTLQHGQKLRGGVEAAMTELGFEVHLPTQDSHLCCGSAGTYSVLQPEIAYQLRDRKVQTLEARQPSVIISGNIGCLQHLQSGTKLPVRHWVEVIDEALAAG
ncbi:glycolate oxidase subunit GlcF [Sphaerotilus sp.]|jgi:glycolate oxidase iron-sulfur subunit|uniref:glycolate oxidase subunit GlcF n=1 Tax=Sphaerotilus sp. TaxID=2093942 RepID=UPI0025CE88CD|nr:glycolate oxidase subunit GlcF [Sphaerotilus sp.]